MSPALLHCIAEATAAGEYTGPELGAVIGWADWLVEAQLICEEESC